MNDMLTEIKFWSQVTEDAKRTVVCSPENESRIKSWLTARHLNDFHKVIVNPIVPDDQVYVLDEQGIEANLREVLSRPIKWSWGPDLPRPRLPYWPFPSGL